MIRPHTARDGTKTYGVRLHKGGARYDWIGSYPTKKLAREAEAKALLKRKRAEELTVEVLTKRFLAVYERSHKHSSFVTLRSSLRLFSDDFGHRTAESIERHEAEDWAQENGWRVKDVITLFNYAVKHGDLERSPFAGLAKRTRGRKDKDPLTEAEVEQLAKCSSALGHYAATFAALVRFAAYSGLRAGELFALEWRDLDIPNRRLTVRRRVYQGELDLPKGGVPRLISLLPQARDALQGLPRTNDLVFPAKQGGMLSQSAMSNDYMKNVAVKFGRPVTLHDFRHFTGWYLYVVKDLPSRVVATQLGNTPRMIETLYGHFRVGALDDLDRAFGENVVPLRDTGGAHGS